MCKVRDIYYGEAHQTGSSHRIEKMPWPGDPRVNIQNAGGMAKVDQARQVVKATDRLEIYDNAKE